ncbi:MAG: L-seryl-tRNA(Sec) selenium transferase [Actinomycetia bacterium]|nr:L-seryl-tRNA(Sec) selenium transferase [Actinomycetes bacterium]
MDAETQKALRALPSVEELLSHPAAAPLVERFSRAETVEAVRAAVDAARTGILSGMEPGTGGTLPTRGEALVVGAGTSSIKPNPTPEALLSQAAALLDAWSQPSLRRVANLSGVVIHTNLGRSALSERAVARVAEVARGYCNLEYDLASGIRGSREAHVESLLKRVTGAEAAFAVNNNAGAVLLLLMALASGREVLVSRGQLVEIGGSFRLPDIIRAGGVRLMEVGTTNRTRLEDYETAIGPDTALLLRVHTSNYRVVGFTEEVSLAQLVELGHRRGLPVADDLGSGALSDLDVFRGEPSVAASLRGGADVVCFSGDKLLGGPQAGILVGGAEVIGLLRRHPVARALRLDKMTLAALEATVEAYRDPERARREVPTLRFLGRATEETAALAAALQAAIERRCGDGFILEVEESSARAGGGSMPLMELPSHAVRIRFPVSSVPGGTFGGTARPTKAAGGPGGSAGEEGSTVQTTPTMAALEAELRRAPLPVVARVAQDSLHLDVIALAERDVETVAESVAWAIARVVEAAGAESGSPDSAPEQ